MFSNKKIEWRQGEKIVDEIKPSALKYFWHYVLAIVLLFGLAFFSFWLIRQGMYGTIVTSACLLASLGLINDARRRRNSNYWILTNERLIDIDKHGALSDTVSSIDYDSIVDIHIRRKGFNARLFSLGDLVVDTESEDFQVSLSDIRHPQIILEWIMQLSHEKADKTDYRNMKLLLKNFYKIIPHLDQTDIREIQNRLDNRLNAESEDD